MIRALRDELLSIRASFKTVLSSEQLESGIRRRTQIQLLHPELDPMLEAWKEVADKYRPLFKGKILDAGCGNGYLFHFLGSPSGYVGVDTCKEAIKVAGEFFPGAEFRVQNLMSVEDRFDVIWCSQLNFPKMRIPPDAAFEKLKSIGDTLIFMIAKEHSAGFTQPHETFGRFLVAVKEK